MPKGILQRDLERNYWRKSCYLRLSQRSFRYKSRMLKLLIESWQELWYFFLMMIMFTFISLSTVLSMFHFIYFNRYVILSWTWKYRVGSIGMIRIRITVIPAKSDHSSSEEPSNPTRDRIHRFICRIMIRVISDLWSWSESSQRIDRILSEINFRVIQSS